MLCRLCLNSTDENIFIFSEEKIQKCIAKFLQLELSPEDPISKLICTPCWQKLDSFQNVCIYIEQAQKTLGEAIEISKLNSNKIFSFPLKEENTSCDDGEGNDLLHKITKVCPEIIEDSPTRRVTRQSTLQRSGHNDSPRTEKVKTKRGRPNKEEITLEKEESIEEKEGKTESNSTASDPNGKRKRGRSKKGEQVSPKVKRPRSEQCSKEFDAIIQKHMNLSCNICSTRLIDFAELKRHFRVVHQRRGYAVCCNKRLFNHGLIVDHINVHKDPEHFKCTKCGKILADRMCPRNHDLLFHQTEELKTFQCPYCPKKYAKQYLLDHHTVKHVPQAECTFFCSECGKGFPTNSTLTNHFNQLHSTVYDKMCEICAKLIRGNANLERHMEEHKGIVQPQVQCTECGSWLKDKNSLRKHMYKHDGKPHICNNCGKIAPSKDALQRHMKYVHQLTRMFHCTFCDKSFKNAVNLKEHMATHTGEVLYTCPHCPKTFNSKANMHSHRKKTHREEWEANRRYPKKELNSKAI